MINRINELQIRFGNEMQFSYPNLDGLIGRKCFLSTYVSNVKIRKLLIINGFKFLCYPELVHHLF